MAFGNSKGAENATGIPLPKCSQEASLPALWEVKGLVSVCALGNQTLSSALTLLPFLPLPDFLGKYFSLLEVLSARRKWEFTPGLAI